jgi:hypothetical protein
MHPSEYLASDEVIVLFKGRMNFAQCIPKKFECFRIKIYKLYDMVGCIYNIVVYIGKDRTCATAEMTEEVEEHGHKLYIICNI